MRTKKSIWIKIGIILALIFGGIYFTDPLMSFRMASVFRPWIRKGESQIVFYQTRNYEQLETQNFIIRYRQIEEETLELIVKTAESKYEKVVEAFEYKPSEKVLLVIYDDPDTMMGVTTLKKGNPPMGVYYGNSIHILDPHFWVKEQEDLHETFYYRGPVLHELVHLFTDHLGKGNFPLWFTEGVSLYFEYKVDGYEWGKEIDFCKEKYTIEELTHNFYNLDEYLAYTKSFRLVKSFVEKHGEKELIYLIERLGKGEKWSDFVDLF